MNNKILLSLYLFSSLQLFGDSSNLNKNIDTASSTTKTERYSILDKNKTYDEPSSFSNLITIDGSWSSNIIQNGDFENGTANWTVSSGSGFVAQNIAGVNHSGNWLYGSNTPGFVIEQKFFMSSFPSYTKYLNINFDFGGLNNKDTSQIIIKFFDSNDTLIKTLTLPKNKGLKNDPFNHYEKPVVYIKSGTSYFIVQVSEIRNNGSDSDGYLDNLEVKTKPNKYYETNSADNITYPTGFTATTYFYSNSGNDLLQPNDSEKWTKKYTLSGNAGNDYIIGTAGQSITLRGNGDNDVLVGYQGSQSVLNEKLYGGSGNDKLYATEFGTNLIANGNSGSDFIILKGAKTDYTLSYDSTNNTYTFSKSGYDITLKDLEAVGFSSASVLSEPNGNITSDKYDLWWIDTNTNNLTHTFPVEADNYFKSVTVKRTPISITDDGSANRTNFIYLMNLPKEASYIEDSAHNKIADVKVGNKNNNTRYYALITLPKNSTTNYYIVEEQNLRDSTVATDLSNVTVENAF